MRAPRIASPDELTALQNLVARLARRETIAEPIANLAPDLVRAHNLAPLAYKAGLSEYRTDYVGTLLIADVRDRHLREAIETLAAVNIPVILLKGVAYLGHLYADPGERPMTDIDLLVPVDRHDAAVDALAPLGYRPGPKLHDRAAVHHAMTLSRRDGAIDLHRSMIQPRRSAIDLDAVWARATPVPNLDALRPEPVDEAILHFTHVGRHELNVPALSYIDGARLLQRLRTRNLADELASRARQFRLSRLIRAGIAMTDALASGTDALALPWPGRKLLPSPREILVGRLPSRPLQLARKAALAEGPRELVGIAAVYARAQAERLRRE